jgi:uracil-DNA glycosylase
MRQRSAIHVPRIGGTLMKNCWTGRNDVAPFVPGIPEEVGRYRSLTALNREMSCCTRCTLAPGRTQVVHGTGPKRARVMFLGEAPGAREDEAGEPFVGAAGRLFARLLEPTGLQRADVYITNVVACRPPKNRTPRTSEVKAHAPWLEEQIRLVRPEVVVTLGRIALLWFVPGGKVTQLTGRPQAVRWHERDLTVLPLFHPAAALRSPDRVPLLEHGFAVLKTLLE